MKHIDLQIQADQPLSRIAPEIYGHFSEHLGTCMYGGIYVGADSPIPNINGVRKDVIDAFRQIRMPVLRWPGGCFADDYHWRDGIGPREQRRKRVSRYWGHITETNAFGTHDFFALCEQIGCEPYLAGNLGSGTVQELSDWIEYITFDGDTDLTELRRKNGREQPWKLKYLGIGNENWGCGGNMRPEYYADEYKRYQSFCESYGDEPLYKIACGANGDDFAWTETLMSAVGNKLMNGLSVHYYTVPSGIWEKKGDCLDFTDAEYYATVSRALYMDTILQRHIAIMDQYDPEGRVGLVVDEWGNWYDPAEGDNPHFLHQQNTMRDAVTAAVNLNLFNRYSKRISMANLAQAVNVLQAILLTEGAGLIKTPTYHVFDLFKGHQGGMLVSADCCDIRAGADGEIPMLSHSASVKDGVLTLTAANCSLDDAAELCISADGFAAAKAVAQVLCADSCRAHNTFDKPDTVQLSALPVTQDGSLLRLTVPPCAVVCVTAFS